MPSKEAERIDALHKLAILDTAPSESFDRITRMASQIFGLPIAAVSLTDTDRQWFKSRVGVDHWSIPRDKAPCSEVAESSDFVLIRDFKESECYRDSVLGVSGIRFYAGAPLVTREGHGLGALCVLGTEPRDISEDEKTALKDLAAMVMSQIEMHHAFGRIEPASGLPNRNQFFEDLEDHARDHAGEPRHAVTIDLVGASDLADVLRITGPSYLDDLITSSSRATRSSLGRARRIYQTGTTQYAYLCDSGDLDRVLADADAVRSALMADSRREGAAFVATPAVGIAPFTLGSASPENILRMAHNAAQDARDTERGISVYSAALDEAHRRRFTLLADMEVALQAPDQLSLVYQPRVDLGTGLCIGAEALLRWTHPELGPVSPGEFIPLVEKSTFARGVTEWVVREAARQVAEWRARGLHLEVSLNISAANLAEPDFAERLVALVAEAEVPPAALEIELTESAIIENGETAIAQLQAISEAGFRIAIDDFGTGYSSLSYLEQIPARILKIDKSFMATLGAAPQTHTMVKAMISLAHDLGYSVVAEGVETRFVFDLLAAQGCDAAQGYFMSRPLGPDALIDWVGNRPAVRTEREHERLSA